MKEIPTSPKDQMWLHEMCDLVKQKCPESHCFVVFAFPSKEPGRVYYAANADRKEVITAIKEWIKYQESGNNWKHDTQNTMP